MTTLIYSFGQVQAKIDQERTFAAYTPPDTASANSQAQIARENSKLSAPKLVTITLPPVPPLVNGATLIVDAVTDEEHKLETEVTKHAVEVGSDITDNLRPKPRSLSLRGLIVSAPLAWPGKTNKIQYDAQGNPIGPDTSLTASAYLLLKGAWQQGLLLTVDTRLAGEPPYQNMAIQSLGMPKATGKGRDLWFSLDLEEVLYASSQTATVPSSAISSPTVAKQAAPRKARGRKTTTTPTPAQSAAAAGAKTKAAGKTSKSSGGGSWLAGILGQ